MLMITHPLSVTDAHISVQARKNLPKLFYNRMVKNDRDLIPVHLRGHEATGWKTPHHIHQYEQGSMQNFVYVLSCPETKKTWIVDPHKDWKKCESDWHKDGYTLAGCLLTHSHHDHVAGLSTLLEAYPDLPVILGKGDFFRLTKSPPKNLQLLVKDTTLSLGSLVVEAIRSPGHSIGEFCYYLGEESPPLCITGDVLFIRQCGRTDFETGSDLELFETLSRLKKLPRETIILPGHHYSPECASLLGTEMKESAPLLAKTWEELRDLP